MRVTFRARMAGYFSDFLRRLGVRPTEKHESFRRFTPNMQGGKGCVPGGYANQALPRARLAFRIPLLAQASMEPRHG